MSTWQRIGDHEHAAFGRRTVSMRRGDTGARYAVTINEGDQNSILFTVTGTNLKMSLDNKAISPGGLLSLSGGISDRDDMLGIDRSAWVEVLLDSPITVSYYGDRVLLRTDTEV